MSEKEIGDWLAQKSESFRAKYPELNVSIEVTTSFRPIGKSETCSWANAYHPNCGEEYSISGDSVEEAVYKLDEQISSRRAKRKTVEQNLVEQLRDLGYDVTKKEGK